MVSPGQACTPDSSVQKHHAIVLLYRGFLLRSTTYLLACVMIVIACVVLYCAQLRHLSVS